MGQEVAIRGKDDDLFFIGIQGVTLSSAVLLLSYALNGNPKEQGINPARTVLSTYYCSKTELLNLFQRSPFSREWNIGEGGFCVKREYAVAL